MAKPKYRICEEVVNYRSYDPYLHPGQEGYIAYHPVSSQHCNVRPNEHGYYCTRKDKHKGLHAAHLENGEMLASWREVVAGEQLVLSEDWRILRAC